jgi:hypothetical protein
MAKDAKSTLASRLGLMIGGLQSNPPTSTKSLVVLGKAYTITQLIAVLVAIQTLLQAVVTAKSAWTKAIAAVKAQSESTASLMAAIRVALIQAYGSDTQGLEGCGITVKEHAKLNSDEQSIKTAKLRATRAANGTGKKTTPPTHTVTVTNAATGQVVGAATGSSAAVVATPAPVVTGHRRGPLGLRATGGTRTGHATPIR